MTVEISELVSQIGGTVLTPGDAGYNEYIKRWASNAERRAAIVVFVSSAADVATAVVSAYVILMVACLHLQRKGEWRLLFEEADIPQPVPHLLKGVLLLI